MKILLYIVQDITNINPQKKIIYKCNKFLNQHKYQTTKANDLKDKFIKKLRNLKFNLEIFKNHNLMCDCLLF